MIADQRNKQEQEERRKRQEEHDTYVAENKAKSYDHLIAIINRARLAKVNNLVDFYPVTLDSIKQHSKLLKEAWDMLSDYEHEMTQEDKDKCFEYITNTQEELNEWFNKYKGYQADRRSDFETRIRNRLDENQERLRKANDALNRVRANMAKLEYDISSAWSDDFKDRAKGWLSEAELRARDIEEGIEKIEVWIREDKARLR